MVSAMQCFIIDEKLRNKKATPDIHTRSKLISRPNVTQEIHLLIVFSLG